MEDIKNEPKETCSLQDGPCVDAFVTETRCEGIASPLEYCLEADGLDRQRRKEKGVQ